MRDRRFGIRARSRDPEEAGRRGSHYAPEVDLVDAAEDDVDRVWNPGHLSVTAAVMICWAILP